MNQKGVAHLLVVLIVLLAIPIGVYLAQNPQIFRPRANQAENARAFSQAPFGAFDSADDTVMRGWAIDPDRPDDPLWVAVYVDGVFFTQFLSDIQLPTIPGAPDFYKGKHGFVWYHPTFGFGTHQVEIYPLGVDPQGKFDGQNTRLAGSPKTITGNCDRLQGEDKGWCLYNPNYWVYRQKDTQMLWSSYISLGVNKSYGGGITQLYNQKTQENLMLEHLGGAMQHNYWFYDAAFIGSAGRWYAASDGVTCDPTPYLSELTCKSANTAKSPYNYCHYRPSAGKHISDCKTVKPCFGWTVADPWDPLQGGAESCGWDSVQNDVNYAGVTSDGGYEIIYNNPFNYTKTDRMTGMVFKQKVNLGDAYAKIHYTVEYHGDTPIRDANLQQIPAIFPQFGISHHFFYYNGDKPFQDPSSAVVTWTPQNSGVPIAKLITYPAWKDKWANSGRTVDDTLTEGWWGVCDASETRCITAALFDPFASDVQLIQNTPNNSYIGVDTQHFVNGNITKGFKKEWDFYIFPYKHNDVIGGKSIRQRIFDLKNNDAPPVPTPLPTPTAVPTFNPSPAPTPEETVPPVSKPTPNPSNLPTSTPASAPTPTATIVATARPTPTPSPIQTQIPTATAIARPTQTPSPVPKTGDLNNDGRINVSDFSLLLSKWRTSDLSGDLNKDGTVNITDLSILLSNWGR